MCTPAIFALALTAAGSAAQAAGARRAAKAMAGARTAESIRQKGFQDQATQVNDQSLSKSGRAATEADMKAAEESRAADAAAATAEVRKPIEATGDNLAGDTTGNAVMASETGQQAARNLGFANQQGAAKANLLSFNDVTFQNAINNMRAGQQLNTISNFMRGSSNVLPIELEAASQKGNNLKTLGTLLSTAGSITGMGAGAGWWDKVPEVASTPSLIKAAPVQVPGQTINLSGFNITPGYNGLINPTRNIFGTSWSDVLKTPIK